MTYGSPGQVLLGNGRQSHLNIDLQMPADEETHYPNFMRDVKYADKASLQTVDICLPRPTARHDLSKLWVMYELCSSSDIKYINN